MIKERKYTVTDHKRILKRHQQEPVLRITEQSVSKGRYSPIEGNDIQSSL